MSKNSTTTFAPTSRTQEFTTGVRSASAKTPQWHQDWDEDSFQAKWMDQHEAVGIGTSGQPDISTVKITGGVGNRRPLDKDDE